MLTLRFLIIVLFVKCVCPENTTKDSEWILHSGLQPNTEYPIKKIKISKIIKFFDEPPEELKDSYKETEHSYEVYLIKNPNTSDYHNSKIQKSLKDTKELSTKSWKSKWGPWSSWSKCSRSCDGGIQFQERKCLTRHSHVTSIESVQCNGIYKRYRLCNEQKCYDTEESFRQQQCSAYNSMKFQGKFYQWEPYIKEDNECELNCKPVGMKYFATLNSVVIDGTTCSRPAEFYLIRGYKGSGVCIDGICKAIHGKGLIQGAYTGSNTTAAVRCGSLMCKPIVKIYDKANLPHGYVHVTSIPAGATNITITEIKDSVNLLILKTSDDRYIINGDGGVSNSGSYENDGSIFVYKRLDDGTQHDKNDVTEWITATGPISKSIDLMILIKDINPGIKYEYFVPISPTAPVDEPTYDDTEWNELDTPLDFVEPNKEENPQEVSYAQPERKRRRYSWKIIGFGPCSKTCGEGRQSPIFRCIRDIPTRFYPPRRCAHLEKPILNDQIYRCNTKPCPAYWHIDKWEDCLCRNSEGYQERHIKCVQEMTPGVIVQVKSTTCLDPKPEYRKKCDCPKSSKKRNNYNKHPKHYRITTNSTNRKLYDNDRTYDTDNPYISSYKHGVWLMSDWNNHCSTECGIGVEHRSIFCDRTPPHSDRCDLRTTPDTSRPCEATTKCDTGEWFTGRWGHCGGECFNLTKKREVFCLRDNVIVEDELCKMHRKPDSVKNCSVDDVKYCKPRWHYSKWSPCSRTCGGGNQRRSVRCLELEPKENILRESQNCRYVEREPVYGSCNTQKCPELAVEPRVDLIQNDLGPPCDDIFPNCHLVIKAKLCSLEYYQRNCCYTCTGY